MHRLGGGGLTTGQEPEYIANSLMDSDASQRSDEGVACSWKVRKRLQAECVRFGDLDRQDRELSRTNTGAVIV